MKAYEDASKRDIKCGQALKPSLKCPKCGCDLIPAVRTNGVRWLCSDAIYCFYSRFEVNR